MPSLQYSTEALDTLSLFHRKKYVIYVEGPDDVPFWTALFRRAKLGSFTIKPAGGKPEIQKYRASIVEGGADIVVACDLHYDDFSGKIQLHPRVIYTFGHSIENTLYAPASVSAVISTFLRNDIEYEDEVRDWLDDFALQLKECVVREIANEMFSLGLRILGESSAPYLQGKDSSELSQERLQGLLDRLGPHFTPEMLETANRALEQSPKPFRYLIRGHFLTFAVWNYVRARINEKRKREAKLSQDALYTLLIGFLEARCSDYLEWSTIQDQVEQLKAAA
jgi:hypothetical protein